MSPLELVDAAIARIERLNPDLNAVVTPMFELARASACEPLPDGPLAGSPFLLKDLGAAYAGVRQTHGSRAMVDNIPTHDDELVTLYKRAGLFTLGRTNTPEFGNSSTTEPILFGPTRNPWAPDRSPGGSSGGSAAAVAAGLVPIAHGTDAGGSIRTPASCCGVFGLKPSRGRVPDPPVLDLLMGWSVNHVITRSVRDSAAVLDAVAVFDPGAVWSLKREGSFLAGLADTREHLRVGYSVEPPSSARVDEACREAVLATAQLLDELGHEVVEASPELSWERFFRVYLVLVAAAWVALVDDLEASQPGSRELLEHANQVAADYGRGLSALDYMEAVGEMQRIGRLLARFFESYDVWLTPTLTRPPLLLGAFDAPSQGSYEQFLAFDADWNPWLPFANCSGATSASLPLHWSQDGLPIGTQCTMAPGEEAQLLRLAAALEEARPWQDRWPPRSIAALSA